MLAVGRQASFIIVIVVLCFTLVVGKFQNSARAKDEDSRSPSGPALHAALEKVQLAYDKPMNEYVQEVGAYNMQCASLGLACACLFNFCMTTILPFVLHKGYWRAAAAMGQGDPHAKHKLHRSFSDILAQSFYRVFYDCFSVWASLWLLPRRLRRSYGSGMV